jgi:hypothetical protein
LYQVFPQKLSRIAAAPTDTMRTGENMSHNNSPLTHTEELTSFLQNFEDEDLQRYTCFASEFRDQRMEAGSMAEAGFWNTVVNLCIDERMRRDEDIRRLEYMYRTGVDPDQYA